MAYIFTHGSGTADDPYLVATADDLNGVRDYLDAHFKQVTDIDLSGYANWEPIGTYSKFFTGTYDGDGHKINKLTIDRQTDDYVGLFGATFKRATLKNVNLMNVEIKGRDMVGGLVGWLWTGGTVINCLSTGNILGRNYIGGIVGTSGSGDGRNTLKGCCGGSSVLGNNYVGGLAGSIGYTNMTDCYSHASASGTGVCIGGLVGEISSSNITYGYSMGIVLGVDKFGGLIGWIGGIHPCYITASFYDQETSGQSDTGKGEPKTTAEMKQQSTFIDWDFDTIWAIDPDKNDGYPYLRWQKLEPEEPPEVLPSYSPQSTIKLEFSAGDSAPYPMGIYYADKSQYKVGSAGSKIDARNSIGKYLKDQTFDEKCNYPSQAVTTIFESMLSGAGLTKYYVQPSTIQMGMNFAPNKDILGGIEEILQYLASWQIREEVDGTVVVAARTDSHFTQPSRYTFQRDRDIFSRDVVTDDRSIYGRVCVHTSDWLVRVYRPITSDLGWTPPAQKTLYQQVPDGTTSLEAANIATNLAASMANSGKVETFLCPFRPQIIPGDEAEILEADESATMLGIITQVKHSFGVQGFFTEIVVDSGGRIGKPKFKEIVSGLKPLPTSKKVN